MVQVLFTLPLPPVASLYSISGEVGRSALGAEGWFQGEMEQDGMKAHHWSCGYCFSQVLGAGGAKRGGWKSPKGSTSPLTPSPLTVHQSDPSGAQKSSCRSGEPSHTAILLFHEEPEHSCLLSLTLLWTSRRLLLQYSDRHQTGAHFRKADTGHHCPGLCWRQPHLLTVPVHAHPAPRPTEALCPGRLLPPPPSFKPSPT